MKKEGEHLKEKWRYLEREERDEVGFAVKLVDKAPIANTYGEGSGCNPGSDTRS